jgi:hypothetical protein
LGADVVIDIHPVLVVTIAVAWVLKVWFLAPDNGFPDDDV